MLMERIGWWFLRHSKRPTKIYYSVCPKCKTVGWFTKKYLDKHNGEHSCGTKFEIYDFF